MESANRATLPSLVVPMVLCRQPQVVRHRQRVAGATVSSTVPPLVTMPGVARTEPTARSAMLKKVNGPSTLAARTGTSLPSAREQAPSHGQAVEQQELWGGDGAVAPRDGVGGLGHAGAFNSTMPPASTGSATVAPPVTMITLPVPRFCTASGRGETLSSVRPRGGHVDAAGADIESLQVGDGHLDGGWPPHRWPFRRRGRGLGR